MGRFVRGGAVAVAACLLGIGAFALPASAHVSIDTFGAVEQGSFAKLGISVPNERDDAGTVKVSVQMPQDHPLTFVSVQPKPGWEVTTTMRTLDTPVEAFGTTISEVVDTVTWTATGETQIGPGQFDQFWISAGPMPTDATELAFPAIQTYSSGEEVAWIEPTPAGGEEPEHPTPTVALVAAGGDTSTAGEGTTSEGTAGEGTGATGEETAGGAELDDDDDDGTDALAVVALVVGAIGVLVGAAGLVVARRATRTRSGT